MVTTAVLAMYTFIIILVCNFTILVLFAVCLFCDRI